MVGMNFRVSINANKEKANQKSKTVNSSSKSHSRNYSNRQNKNSAKSVLTVSSDTPCNALNGLHEQRLNHPKNVIMGHLNINSIRNKFSGFKDLVHFQTPSFSQKAIECFEKIEKKNGGGLILYVNEDIPGKLINSYNFKEESEIIVFEFSISNKKWLLLGSYKPPSQNELSFINEIKLPLNFSSSSYENFLLLGDFNLSTENPNFKNLLNSFDLESLIKIPTYCKSLSSPTSIDLILTNKKNFFMKSTTFETGMSDFHKLTTTISRNTISKGNAKKIFYRDYKAFDHSTFETRLQSKLKSETIVDYSQSQSIFLETLDNIAPVKTKILRYNNNPFMNKALRKAIMTRSGLKNKFNKNSSAKNWNSYKKQRNFCLKLLRQTKEKYFNNINVKKVSDNKTLWKSVKPFFSNKGLNSNNILLVEGNEIISDDGKIATIINMYFTNITKHMNLKANKISHREEIVNILNTFINHKSVPRIKLANFRSYSTLNFSKVTESEVTKEILNLSTKKATKNCDIPAKILKKSVDIYIKKITFIINDCFEKGIFPYDLKLADVSPIFKKEDSFKKENYRPVSILPHMSKVFERILYKQIDTFMITKFYPYLCGFRKNHNAQYLLLKMVETWKKHLDKGEKIGVIMMDLSKAFDTINHSLLLAKLDAYGVSRTSLKLMQNYLCNR